MAEVTGKTFEGKESVETDGNTFTNCNFKSAVLVYRGGEHPFFEACRFGPDVSWRFFGPALTTIQFLQRIASDDGGQRFIMRLFEKGRYFADEPPGTSPPSPEML
jgi:hypothetical protein